MEQQPGSKYEKECVKAVYCHPAYLTYIQRISCEVPGLDEAQAGVTIAGTNINNPTYADDTTQTAETKEEVKSFLIKVKKESEKAGLKLKIQKTKIMIFSPMIS